MAEIPEILAINVGSEISGPLWRGFQGKFGGGCRISAYSRPDSREHPRMRPERGRGGRLFDVVIFDIGRIVGGRSAEAVLDLDLVPQWFEEDVLRVLSSAILVVLSPATSLQGVRANFAPFLRRRPSIVREREPALWRRAGVHPAGDVFTLWKKNDSSPQGGTGILWEVANKLKRLAPPD